ncbi:MAG TPA: hypothetical protein VIM74_06170, partial [Casimicrobiaceae bacterium]
TFTFFDRNANRDVALAWKSSIYKPGIVKKLPGARDLLGRIRKYRGRLPADFKFDRLEANERR